MLSHLAIPLLASPVQLPGLHGAACWHTNGARQGLRWLAMVLLQLKLAEAICVAQFAPGTAAWRVYQHHFGMDMGCILALRLRAAWCLPSGCHQY